MPTYCEQDYWKHNNVEGPHYYNPSLDCQADSVYSEFGVLDYLSQYVAELLDALHLIALICF